MKLAKEEIKFIDNYLIKNEVKYWDVRMELLDHIILAVEAHIAEKKLTFLEALAQVHRGFGNQLIPPRYKDEYYLEKTLYQANNGFQKFIQTKQRELSRRYGRQYRKTLGGFLVSKQFLLEFFAVLVVVIICHFFNSKTAAILATIVCFIPEVVKLVKGLLNITRRKSLQLQAALLSGSLWFSLSYLFLFVFGLFTEKMSLKPYYIISIVFICLFPFLRHGLNVFNTILKDNTKTYNLLQS